ncbi:DUF4253 domain-containing protein [Streptomyces sp. NPDC006739]|uniref:DUF4253 domain-containing protein n=1 Tax=Streptomyces sp. NPDC006739 TaxID=3364763 RepID=UPI0036806939
MATLPNPLPTLATDPSGRSLGLRLPPGRLIDDTEEGSWHEPLLWHADVSAAPGAWKALGGPAARAGLLPLLVDVEGEQGGPATWELMPGEMSYPGDHDADAVLAEYWEDIAEELGAEELGAEELGAEELGAEETGGAEPSGAAPDGLGGPLGGEWPGLAPPAPDRTVAPDVHAARVADSLADGTLPWCEEPRLALVPARRSADLPAAIGWTGPLNHENDVARLCAVLRSWEDRFGIRVVALGFDSLVVSVAAPPATPAQAGAIAAEHLAFCPDAVTQDDGTVDLPGYAKELVGAPHWSFWWD